MVFFWDAIFATSHKLHKSYDNVNPRLNLRWINCFRRKKLGETIVALTKSFGSNRC